GERGGAGVSLKSQRARRSRGGRREKQKPLTAKAAKFYAKGAKGAPVCCIIVQHVIPQVSHLSLSDRLAGWFDFLSCRRSDGVLGPAYAASGRVGGGPVAGRSALDGHFLRSNLSGKFSYLQLAHARGGASVCSQAFADLHDADPDFDFAVRSDSA